MTRFRPFLSLVCVVAFVQFAVAQPPRDSERDRDQRRPPPTEPRSPIEHIMSHDQNDDGVIEESELVDERMRRMFERADKDQDGKLTREELEAEFKPRDQGESTRRRGPDGPPRDRERRPVGPPRDRDRGPDGPPRDRESGPGRFGPPPFGPGGPPKPGTVLPRFIQDSLELNEEQRERLADLQKRVDAQLKEILTSEQQERLERRQGMFPPRRGPDDRGDREYLGRGHGDHEDGDHDRGPREGRPRNGRRPPPRD